MKWKRRTNVSVTTVHEDKSATIVSYRVPSDFEVPEEWKSYRSAFIPSPPDRDLTTKYLDDLGFLSSDDIIKEE